MATSLYDLSVGSYLQLVSAVAGFLDKGASHCSSAGIPLDGVVSTRLYEDMLPFHFQVGEFGPPSHPETDYAGLQKLIGGTLEELKAVNADELNKLAGGKVIFKLGSNEIPFTAENFVLSFSLPNLYFHAATAYDILRMKGVPLGKRDFLGKLRMGA